MLQRLGTLGPDWGQQFRTELGQLPHGAKAQAHEVTVIAYVRGVSTASLPLRAGGNIKPKDVLVELLVQHYRCQLLASERVGTAARNRLHMERGFACCLATAAAHEDTSKIKERVGTWQ